MFDVKGVDIKIEIRVLEDFNTIKDRSNLIPARNARRYLVKIAPETHSYTHFGCN